jgi:iron complex outermembrane receptor protein
MHASSRPLAALGLSATLLLDPGPGFGQTTPPDVPDLAELTPEQLSRIEVTSVSKKPESRWRTAAAVHVITREDIRRSGATTLVEALRLAPGVQVARVDANTWAVGVRGFASSLTRSLLVTIDGRSVYTPLFAGTYWEVQDVLLEDVERIEVIRGPGGSLWGANAVNGIINVITRSSRDTTGAYVTAGGGSPERGLLGARYGGTAGNLTYRVYAKGFDRGPAFHESGDAFDEWRMGQAGFRTDWTSGQSHRFELHGDLYRGSAGSRAAVTLLRPPFVETVDADTRLRGANVVGRWQHTSPGGAEWSLRSYYDRTHRREVTFGETRHTFDVELQRGAALGRHDLVVGAGYRFSTGRAEGVPTVQFLPARRGDHLWSGFFRDEISFADGRVHVALGSKLEHNDYSGLEVQPTLQLLWAPTPAQAVWAAAARSVRTPSRIEHDLTLEALADARTPAFARLVGDPTFGPEKVITVEAGYRRRLGSRLAVYTVAFHNTHQDLLSLEPGAPRFETTPPPARLVVPITFGNGIGGTSHGAEAVADLSLRDWWRLAGAYSFLHMDLASRPGSLDTTTAATTNGTSPRHMAVVQSQMDLWRRTALDLVLRYVDELSAPAVPAYTTLDARVGWRPHPSVELAVVGQNLLQAHHGEFGARASRIDVRRGAYGTVTWRP